MSAFLKNPIDVSTTFWCSLLHQILLTTLISLWFCFGLSDLPFWGSLSAHFLGTEPQSSALGPCSSLLVQFYPLIFHPLLDPQAVKSNCLLDVSTWMIHRSLKIPYNRLSSMASSEHHLPLLIPLYCPSSSPIWPCLTDRMWKHYCVSCKPKI